MVLLAATPFLNGCRSARSSAEPDRANVSNERGKSAKSQAAMARAHAHFAEGVVHELNEDVELALQAFRRALDEDPGDETLVLEVSRRFLLHKKPGEALEMLRNAAKRKGASGEIYARLGAVYSLQGHGDEALAANQMAVKKSPLHLPAYQNLMMNLLQAKRGEEGLRLLDDAARTDGADAEFLIGLADLYHNYTLQFPTQREAVNARTLAVLRRAAEMKPVEPELRLRLADGLFQLGESQTASQIYLPLLEQMADMPLIRDNVRSRLVEIFLRADDRVRAREQLEALSREDPSNPQAYYLLGSLAYDDRRWKDAAELFRKTLLFAPNFEQAHYDLAAAQLASDDASGALATLRRASGKFNPTFLLEYLTALAEGRAKNFAEAIKHFTQAEIIAKAGEPRRLTAEFYFEVGVAFERKGDRAEAARYFERALELKPEFPEAQNYLGYMWAEQGENLERAKELIEKALQAEPKSAAYLDSMGWVLFKLNQPKAALDYLLEAVKLIEAPDATLYDHLGDIYAALNETEKAQDAWRKSLAVEDSPVVRKKLPGPVSP
jgi:tetratricopeptide (TPR) repeat protein